MRSCSDCYEWVVAVFSSCCLITICPRRIYMQSLQREREEEVGWVENAYQYYQIVLTQLLLAVLVNTLVAVICSTGLKPALGRQNLEWSIDCRVVTSLEVLKVSRFASA